MSIETTLTDLDKTKVYRIRPRQLGGFLYQVAYAEGDFIHVRVLEGPDQHGRYKMTTRDENGEHLGPGGGWIGESIIYLWPFDVEDISGKPNNE